MEFPPPFKKWVHCDDGFGMQALNFIACRLVLGGVFLLVFTLPVMVIKQFIPQGEGVERFQRPLALWMLGAFLSAGWFAHRTAHHLTLEDRNLYNALRFTFWDTRMYLSFLPVIGKWFVPREEKPEQHALRQPHGDGRGR